MIMINFLSVVSCLTNMWLNLEGNTKQSLIQVGSAQGPTPHPLIYHFLWKGYPCCIRSIDKWYPFHTPSLKLSIASNCCKCTVF